MAQKGFRFGVISAARIVPNALIDAAKLVPEVEVTAVAARDPARAREFAAQHGIPRVLATYDEVINDRNIDVIYNPLPNALHHEWTIKALRAGKPVLCEKPLCSNTREAEEMARVADETGLLLGEAFHYHYHPLANRVREIIKGGSLGKLAQVEGRFSVPIPADNIRYDWKLAGGATMDLGCYPLHMIHYFTGRAPKVVSAKATTGPEQIDVAMEADLRLDGGVTAKMICAMTQDSPIAVTFIAKGDRGELHVLNPLAPQRGNRITVKTADGEKQESISGDSTFTYQLRAFVAALRGEAKFATDARAGVENMRVIDDVYRAAGLRPRAT